MDNRPPIWYGVVLAFVAAGMIAASPLGIAWLPLQAGLGILALALVIGWVAAFVAWAEWHRVERLASRREAEAITPRLRTLQALRGLTPEQLALLPKDFLHDEALKVGYKYKDGKWEAHLLTEQGPVPFDFVELFLRNSDDEECWKIGDTSNKTDERDYARALTGWLIGQSFAVEATGPYSARWIGKSYSQVCAMFGVEENGHIDQETETE